MYQQAFSSIGEFAVLQKVVLKMAIEDILVTAVKDYNDIPFNLLLLADPSKTTIEKYIHNSSTYRAELNGKVVGCYVLFKIDKETIEIKNIAVDEDYQGKGIGTYLLKDAIEKSKLEGARKIMIGTGNASIGQLYLYQKAGFRITDINPDFFVENYEEAIWENGIQCRDMIILSRVL